MGLVLIRSINLLKHSSIRHSIAYLLSCTARSIRIPANYLIPNLNLVRDLDDGALAL
jgi:hypothetical protein